MGSTSWEHAAVSPDEMPIERRMALERLFAHIGDMVSLPVIGQKILRLTESESSSLDELREVIQTDPILVSKILRRLNSSYFGLSHKVKEIGQAVNLLGFREIRNLALTVFLSKVFDHKSTYKTYNRENLWSHCVGVGAAARLVSRVCGRAAAEEAYLAGLLHDIGFILLDQSLHRHFRVVLDQLNPQEPTYRTENRILSFDHATLGGFVARKWNFPDSINDAITYHHHAGEYRGEHRDLVHVVAVANYLCSRSGWMSLGIHNVEAPPDSVFQSLGLDEVTVSIIWDELEGTLQKSSSLAIA